MPTATEHRQALTANIVLKFYFPKRNLQAAGLPLIQRLPEPDLDAMHAAQLPTSDKRAEVGRHRQGRVDTGEPIFGKNGLANANVGMLKRSVHGAGYSLIDMHRFEKNHVGQDQIVVCMTFRHDSKGEHVTPSEDQRRVMKFLTECTWQAIHVWDNTQTPNENFTVNCMGQLLDRTPQRMIVIRGHQIVWIDPREQD